MHGGMLKPLGERVLVTRTDGHGVETVTKGGIIVPATVESSVQTKRDYFRARVEAMGDEAKRLMPDLCVGNEVLVHTYSGTAASVYTGESTHEGLFVKPEDILGVVEP
jgi:co-chaperonin GroES (HSP10)